MRKKQSKKIVLLILFCILCLSLVIGIIAGFKKPAQEPIESITQSEETKVVEIKEEKNLLTNEVQIVENIKEKEIVSEIIPVENTIISQAVLKINNIELQIPLREDISVYEALKTLAAEGNIILEGKEYPGLGFFVTQVGPLVNGDGKNLMYYINGKEASMGVSSYIIKEGDIIEWKLK